MSKFTQQKNIKQIHIKKKKSIYKKLGLKYYLSMNGGGRNEVF